MPPVVGTMACVAGGSTQWRGRSVISKVVSLLDAFSPATPELSLGELAQITGPPVSTTYRLASELVAWGGLERGDGAGYRIGLRVWELGALAQRGRTLRELALPFMQDLYEATHENVNLAVRDGREALYVDTISGRGAIPVRSGRGGRLPLHATGVGKVLLAYSPPELLGELVEAGLRRYTPAHRRRARPPAPRARRGAANGHRLRARGDEPGVAVGRCAGGRPRRRRRRRARRRTALRARRASARARGAHRGHLDVPGAAGAGPARRPARRHPRIPHPLPVSARLPMSGNGHPAAGVPGGTGETVGYDQTGDPRPRRGRAACG